MKLFLLLVLTVIFIGCGSTQRNSEETGSTTLKERLPAVGTEPVPPMEDSIPIENINLVVSNYKDAVSIDEHFIEDSFIAKDKDGNDITESIRVVSSIDYEKEGVQSIVFEWVDANNKVIERVRKEIFVKKEVFVKEDTPPVLVIKGKKEISIFSKMEYIEKGFLARDLEDGDLTAKVKVSGSVDSTKVGEYTLRYSVTDSFGNVATETRVVTIKENKKPTITLDGDKAIKIYVGQSYSEFGYIASDKEDGDLTAKVTVSGSVDSTNIGEYTLRYSVTDSFGNISTVTRVIKVIKNELPIIVLKGAPQITVYQNDVYQELGYTSSDKEDGDLTASVVVIGSVDTTRVGTYTKTYTVTDSFGNTSTATRVVKVLQTDDIRVKILSGSSFPAGYKFDLWDYMVNKSDNTMLIQKFENQIKIKNDLHRLDLVSPSEMKITLAYTLRKLDYIDNEDSITINFIEEGETLKTISLNKYVTLNEEVVPSCFVTSHFDKVSLSGFTYSDVIKLSCGSDIAYFVKDKGLVVEDKVVASEIETSSFFESNSVEDLVAVSCPLQLKVTDYNYESVKQANIEALFSAPYNLSGAGITVGLTDVSAVNATHVEFGGRVTNLTTRSVDYHATHVAGTIAASGVNQRARGFASSVEIMANSYKEKFFGASMKDFADRNILISSHSYGFTTPISVGEYDYHCRLGDKVVSENPYIIAIKAAGNDRNKLDYPDYGCIKSFPNAKNIITVGALNSDNSISSFSSTGPVKNGRLKPDVVSRGSVIYSTGISGNESYKTLSGTSMATPAVTGLVTLMQEEYIKVNDDNMTEDLAKGILAQTAHDLGRAGPDYEYGYGLVDGLEAVKVIDSMASDSSLVHKETIVKGNHHEYKISVDEELDFKATLSWIDIEQKSSDYSLNVDLDVYIKDDSGTILYAYSLNPNAPEDIAVKDKFNSVDNLEQIEAVLPAGDYTVIVDVKGMKFTTAQNYSLISNISLGEKSIMSDYLPINEFETIIYNIGQR